MTNRKKKSTYLDIAYFGGHRRYILPSQPFSACNCRRGNYFFQIDPRLFFVFLLLFCLFFSCFSTCFFCAQHEGTNQAPTATLSTYRKHSRAACNRPCTEQQSTYSSTFVSTRLLQRKPADKTKSSVAETMYEHFMLNICLLYTSPSPRD